MIRNNDTLHAHRKSLYLVLLCLSAMVILFLATVVKDLRTRRQLEQQVSEASRQADRSVILTPLVAELQQNGDSTLPGIDGIANIQPPSEPTAEDYERIIGQMIRQCNLEQTALAPDLQSILSSDGDIRVNLTTRGDFSDFRRLILQLGRLPFLSGIERYYVQRRPDADGLEMFLRLRIQLTASPDGTDAAGGTTDEADGTDESE